MLPWDLLSFITRWLAIQTENVNDTAVSPKITFTLRHQHTVSSTAQVAFSNVDVSHGDFVGNRNNVFSYSLRHRPLNLARPSSHEEWSTARLLSRRRDVSPKMKWDEDEVPGPDVEDRETLLTLAKMTNNAYVEPSDKAWYNLGSNWTVTYPIGWEPDADGFRGHIFANEDNSTVVISIKGTSAAFLGDGGPTVKKDKLNDNLLFSCCCARVGWSWTTVCDCYRRGWQCDLDCLQTALTEDSLFYSIGTNLYYNVTYMYPDSNIWIIGHSLGGSLASLLGATFGVPVVAFEAPGEKMAASRLHLPMPPSTHHITHVYHTADPIAMGTCNGVLSACAIGGYAMESRCHLGRTIVYDTVTNLSWATDIRTHGIVNVIEKLLSVPWAPAEEVGRQVPEALPQDDCVECYSWEFGQFPISNVSNCEDRRTHMIDN